MVGIIELWSQVVDLGWGRQQRKAYYRGLPVGPGGCVAVDVGAEFREVELEYAGEGGQLLSVRARKGGEKRGRGVGFGILTVLAVLMMLEGADGNFYLGWDGGICAGFCTRLNLCGVFFQTMWCRSRCGDGLVLCLGALSKPYTKDGNDLRN